MIWVIEMFHLFLETGQFAYAYWHLRAPTLLVFFDTYNSSILQHPLSFQLFPDGPLHMCAWLPHRGTISFTPIGSLWAIYSQWSPFHWLHDTSFQDWPALYQTWFCTCTILFASCSCQFLVWLSLRLWEWRTYVLWKHQAFFELLGITTQKATHLIYQNQYLPYFLWSFLILYSTAKLTWHFASEHSRQETNQFLGEWSIFSNSCKSLVMIQFPMTTEE